MSSSSRGHRLRRRCRWARQCRLRQLPICVMVPMLVAAALFLVPCNSSGPIAAAVELGTFRIPRSLATGDFEELNDLIRPATFTLPDYKYDRDLISFDVTNLQCSSFQIGDVRISSTKDSSQRVSVPLSFIDLDMVCAFDYRYRAALVFTGRGSATVISSGSDVDTKMALTTSRVNLIQYPPEKIDFEQCTADIVVNDIDFRGGVVAWVANAIEGSLRGRIASTARDKLCATLDEWSRTRIANWLEVAARTVARYAPEPVGYEVNPLATEKALIVPSFVSLLNLRQNEAGMAKWVQMAMDKMVNYFQETSYDLHGTGTRSTDLNVNIFMREHFLNVDKSLDLEIEEFAVLEKNGLLWEGTDRLTKSSIFLKNVKVKGLDTFTKFDPFVTIGDFTVQNLLSWKYLEFEFDLTCVIQPSDRSDSVLSYPPNSSVVEDTTLQFKMENVSAALSLMLAVDRGLLEEVEIGSLLRTSKIFSCLLSTIFDVEVSDLSLTLDTLSPPTLTGFVSPGLDRMFSGVTDAAFLTFRDLLISRLPVFFNRDVRSFLNSKILSSYWEPADSSDCSWSKASNIGGAEALDLRDLLLSPEDAALAGGTGSEPYGNLFSSVVIPLFEDSFLPINEQDDLPLLNSRIIRPLTKIQSGMEGELVFSFDLFQSSTLLDAKASNLTVTNLDTVQSPLRLLNPIEPYVLSNDVRIGPVSNKPLTISTRLLVSIAGDDIPIEMNNELEVEMKVPSLELIVDAFAAIKEERLLSFPLRDIDNYNCWLDTALPVEDVIADETMYGESPIDLARFLVSLSEISLASRCIRCSSAGLFDLNDVLAAIELAGFSSVLQSRVDRLLEEIVWDYWQRLSLDDILKDAPKRCPHSPGFAGNVGQNQDRSVDFGTSALSVDTIETIAGIGVLFAEVVLIIGAKSHKINPTFSDPLSGQAMLENGSQYVDWTALDKVLGENAMSALQFAGDYVTKQVDDEEGTDFGLNSILRRFLLEKDGRATFGISGWSLTLGGTLISFDELHVQGLDSVSSIDHIFRPVGPQTLQSELSFEKLKLTFDVKVSATPINGLPNEERMSISFGMDNVSLDLTMLLAVDQATLGKLQMGSMMQFENIVKCLLSRVGEMAVTQLVVRPMSMDALQVDGFPSSEFETDLNSILRSTFESFRDDVISGTPLMFDDTGRKLINRIIGNMIGNQSSNLICDLPDTFDGTGYVDFRDLFLSQEQSQEYGGGGQSPFGDIFRIMYQYMNDNLLTADAINSYLAKWTKSQSGVEGSAWYVGEFFNSSSAVTFGGFAGDAHIVLSDVMCENIDSVREPLALLDPMDGRPNVLNSVISFGNGESRFHVGARALFGLSAISDTDTMNLRNEIDLGMSLTFFSFMLTFFLNTPQASLYEFPLEDLFNVNCWLATILAPWEDAPDTASAGVVNQSIEAEDFTIDVSCVSCSSPRFDDLISDLYSSSDGNNEDAVLNAISRGLFSGSFLRDRLLLDASRQCPHRLEYNADAKWGDSFSTLSETTQAEKAEKSKRDKKARWFNIVMAIVTTIVLSAVVLFRVFSQRKHKIWVSELDDEGFSLLRQQEAKEEEMEQILTDQTRSLFMSNEIPARVRYGVPFLILLDVGLFAAGHFAPISVVDLRGNIAGEPFFVDNFLSFKFLSSAVRTYQNGGNEMALFIVLISGIYPYIKLTALTAVWFAPPRLLGGLSRRGSLLHWLDVLAKLSVIDIVTMMLLAATFLVFLGGPVKAISSNTNENYSVEAIVTPGVGIYSFITAQKISRVCSRYLLGWHRRIVTARAKEYEMELSLPYRNDVVTSNPNDQSQLELDRRQGAEDTKATMNIGLSSSRRSTFDHHQYIGRLSRIGRSAPAFFSAITSCSVFVIGIVVAPSIKLDTAALWSLVLDSGQTFSEAIHESFFRTISRILLQARFVMDSRRDYIGLFILFGLVAISSVLLPLTQSIIKFGRRQRCCRRRKREDVPAKKPKVKVPPYVKRIYLWKGMDVYIISFIIAIWQLGAVSAYVVHLFCSLLDSLYGTLAYVGLAQKSDAQCYRVQATLPLTITILCASLSLLSKSFYLQASENYRHNLSRVDQMIENEAFSRTSQYLCKTARSNSSFWKLDQRESTAKKIDTEPYPEGRCTTVENSSSDESFEVIQR